MNLAHVLAFDPTGKILPGYLITEPRELAVLKLAGAVVLPVDEDIAPPNSQHPLDGFQIRSWGKGWPVTRNAGEFCCNSAIRVLPDRTNLYWAARVVPLKGLQGTGRIRLVGNTVNPAFLSAGLSHKVQPDLLENTPIDKQGGWTIEGCGSINVTSEGILSVGFYAVARNVRIMWTAISHCSFGNQG